MLATTNSRTNEILEVLEEPIRRVCVRDAETEYLNKLADLRQQRFAVEARGVVEEHEALAAEYLAIGALANYEMMSRKARALRGAE